MIDDHGKQRRARPRLEVRVVTASDWPLIETLFGANGACGGCWCMHWRMAKGADWDREKGARNKDTFARLLASGVAKGCLAFDRGEPVGWCCFGPRADFARLQRSRVLQRDTGSHAWAVVCFFIPARHRRRGVGSALLRGAVLGAKAAGARCLEGYPVQSKAGERDYPATFAFTGVPQMFERAGFREVTSPGAPRRTFRRRFRSSSR